MLAKEALMQLLFSMNAAPAQCYYTHLSFPSTSFSLCKLHLTLCPFVRGNGYRYIFTQATQSLWFPSDEFIQYTTKG